MALFIQTYIGLWIIFLQDKREEEPNQEEDPWYFCFFISLSALFLLVSISDQAVELLHFNCIFFHFCSVPAE